MELISKYFNKKFAPRWLILSIDLMITCFSLFLAYLLRFNFEINAQNFDIFPLTLSVYVVIRLATFRYFRSYSGIVRYTSTEDTKRVFLATVSGNALILFFNLLAYAFLSQYIVPFSIYIIDLITALFLMTSFRLSIKMIYNQIALPNKEKKNVIVFGAGRSGIITKRTIDEDGETDYRVVAFLDDDPEKIGKTLEGTPIYSPEDHFEHTIEDNNVNLLIFSIQEVSTERKQEIIEYCLKHNVELKNVPPAEKWLNGELSLNQIKNVRIDDLLEREPIKLDKDQITHGITDKVIMVTGASGSIGSEVVRQLIYFNPTLIVLVDQSESPLNDLQLELNEYFDFINFEPVIGDVRDQVRIDKIINYYKPHVIYHVAAYKHVPLLELNPNEAITTNVLGTKIVADLSIKYDVEKFVMISTDKAVNPTNVMGASKRIAEIYAQSLNGFLDSINGDLNTSFITTRFGNVLGSNGSVIPRFRKQIENGGPVTVTHPDISRYFMTIPEACQLILEAGVIGEGGEVFIFDMGESVRIVDLARKMIKLSGFEPYKDISIKFTGLRQGEKIYEELLNQEEGTLPTHHEKIMIAKVREYSFNQVSKEIDDLIKMAEGNDHLETEIVTKMKQLLPEYKSQNSIYERLDSEVTQ